MPCLSEEVSGASPAVVAYLLAKTARTRVGWPALIEQVVRRKQSVSLGLVTQRRKAHPARGLARKTIPVFVLYQFPQSAPQRIPGPLTNPRPRLTTRR